MEQVHWPHSLDILFYVGLLFLSGQLFAFLANLIKLPRMVGYLIAGIILGPSILDVFTEQMVNQKFDIVTQMALPLIGFLIGGSIKKKEITSLGSSVIWMALLQGILVYIFVSVSVWQLFEFVIPSNAVTNNVDNLELAVGIILGAISLATAPAAILSLAHEYMARGRFTSTLFGIIAIDDALGLLFYAFTLVMVNNLLQAKSENWVIDIAHAILTLVVTVLVGALMALVMRVFLQCSKNVEIMLAVALGVVLVTNGLAVSIGLSPILTTMVLGFLISNYVSHDYSEEAFSSLENIEEAILGIFFVLAGAHLNINIASKAFLLTLIVVVSRYVGKILGTYLGGVLGHAPEEIKKYLGIALLPSAGVSIGLILEINRIYNQTLSELTPILVSVVVGMSLINELSSPLTVGFALRKSGEVGNTNKGKT